MKKNKTVFDTNVWISYIIKDQYKELAVMVEKKGVIFLRSAPSLAELQEVLSRKKFQKYKFDFEKTIAFYINLTKFCKTNLLFQSCPDPKDNFLFDLAIQGKADYLVSGNKKVLETPIENKMLKVTTLVAFKNELK